MPRSPEPPPRLSRLAAGGGSACGGAERLAALLGERPAEKPRLTAALRLVLSGGHRAVADLVHDTGLSRRLLLDLLHGMGGDLAWDGEIVHFVGTPGQYAQLSAAGGPGNADVGDQPSPAEVERMGQILARAPAPVRALDHVPATAETVLRRALYMAREFDLARTRVLFAGDHDCTSLAFGVLGLAPRAVTVTDIDEPLLGFIAAEAAAGSVPVVPLFADLRIGLPEGARGAHDVVFSDPPYTADGVGLFAARAVEALAEPVNGRVLVAYGHSESTPALGLKVQRALSDLDLLFEAVLPGFNRYRGAESIGSSASLYRLRPTRRTAAIARRKAGRYASTIYTQGSQAAEAGRRARAGAAAVDDGETGSVQAVINGGGRDVAQAVLDRFCGDEGQRAGARGPGLVLAGPGWAQPGAVTTERFLAGLPGGGLPGGGLPRGGLPGDAGGTAVVDLRPLFGWSLVRAGLAASASRLIVIVPMGAFGVRSEAEQDLLRSALAPKYEVESLLRPFGPDSAATGTPRAARGTGAAAVVVFRRSESPEPVAAYVWDRPHGRLGNTWREALIAAARSEGSTLTKNEARAVIDQAGIPSPITAHRIIDLPAATLIKLRTAIGETAGVTGRRP